jgi:hypothetical protein
MSLARLVVTAVRIEGPGHPRGAPDIAVPPSVEEAGSHEVVPTVGFLTPR